MKNGWAIAWDISSYDGEKILSVWTNIESAKKEYDELSDQYPFKDSIRIVEFEFDKHNNISDSL